MDSESMEPYTWRKGPRVNDEYVFDDGGDPTVFALKAQPKIYLPCSKERASLHHCDRRTGIDVAVDGPALCRSIPARAGSPRSW